MHLTAATCTICSVVGDLLRDMSRSCVTAGRRAHHYVSMMGHAQRHARPERPHGRRVLKGRRIFKCHRGALDMDYKFIKNA